MPQILIVDDVATIRQIVTAVMRSVGYQVHEAGSGEDALALAEKQRVHLVLADMNLPGMTGLDLVSRLRATKAYRSTPIVMLTKGGKGDDLQRAQRVGASGWIEKPFTPEKLLATVNQVLVDHYVH